MWISFVFFFKILCYNVIVWSKFIFYGDIVYVGVFVSEIEVGIGGISVWKFCILNNKILFVFYFEVVNVYLNIILLGIVFFI